MLPAQVSARAAAGWTALHMALTAALGLFHLSNGYLFIILLAVLLTGG